MGLGVKERRWERDVLQAAWAWDEGRTPADERERIQAAEQYVLCFRFGPRHGCGPGDTGP